MFDERAIELILVRSFDSLRCRSAIELMLPCSIEQFREQFATRMRISFFRLRPVIGTLQGTRLTVRKPYRERYYLWPVIGSNKLSAELIDHAEQTLLRGSFAAPFLTLYTGFLVLAGLAFVPHFIESLISVVSEPSRLLVDLLAMLAHILFFAFARRTACEQKAFLIGFLRTVGTDASRTAHSLIVSNVTDKNAVASEVSIK